MAGPEADLPAIGFTLLQPGHPSAGFQRSAFLQGATAGYDRIPVSRLVGAWPELGENHSQPVIVSVHVPAVEGVPPRIWM